MSYLEEKCQLTDGFFNSTGRENKGIGEEKDVLVNTSTLAWMYTKTRCNKRMEGGRS
jgi:hypothetical protein